jgi:hypothetical protein
MINLDEMVFTAPAIDYNISPNGAVLIEASEIQYAEGYAWKMPVHEFTCFTADTNFGGYKTGYMRILIVAPATDCTETVTLERASWWEGDGPMTIAITFTNVGQGAVSTVVIAVPNEEGMFYHRMRKGEDFTLYETKGTAAEDFHWQLPVMDQLTCLEVVSSKTEDLLREVTLKAI